MANHVLWLHYRLTTQEEFKTYAELLALSLASARKHLRGDWEPLIIGGDHSHLPYNEAVSAMYCDLFDHLQRLYDEGHNILHLDPDVAFVKPTRIFGRFRSMRLFWHTDPPQRNEFDPYLNAGVVYLPASMDPALWQFVDYDAAGMREWNDSQDIFNRMFYDQHPVPRLRPRLNWSPNVPSPIGERRAQVVHLNSTRGADEALERMRELCAFTS